MNANPGAVPSVSHTAGNSAVGASVDGGGEISRSSAGAGTVLVKLHHDSETCLVVQDDGIGCGDNLAEGTGSMLMQLLTRQLDGTLRRESASPGCRVELRIPRT